MSTDRPHSDPDPQPAPRRDAFLMALVIIVVLVIFTAGGVVLGLHRAARKARQQPPRLQQMEALARALAGQSASPDADKSLYQVTPSQQAELIPGTRTALRFDSAEALDQWLASLTDKPLAQAMPRLQDVCYIRRVETLNLPSEQIPPPQVSRYFRLYRLDQPPGWLELETDADQTTILQARRLDRSAYRIDMNAVTP